MFVRVQNKHCARLVLCVCVRDKAYVGQICNCIVVTGCSDLQQEGPGNLWGRVSVMFVETCSCDDAHRFVGEAL